MKIITYNLNGIRAATKLNILDWLKQEDADVICLQEVRAEQKVCEDILKDFKNKYSINFNCGEKKGYSGTVTLSKMKPIKIITGLESDTFRELNPNQIQYTWRSYKARSENNDYGWRFRFDYIICSKVLKNKLRRCYSLDLEYSDHLPVLLEVD